MLRHAFGKEGNKSWKNSGILMGLGEEEQGTMGCNIGRVAAFLVQGQRAVASYNHLSTQILRFCFANIPSVSKGSAVSSGLSYVLSYYFLASSSTMVLLRVRDVQISESQQVPYHDTTNSPRCVFIAMLNVSCAILSHSICSDRPVRDCFHIS